MRQVTIHLAPGETDRQLQRAVQALDPRAQVLLVSGRHGRAGVRCDARLALRYLAAVDTLEQIGRFTDGTLAVSAEFDAAPSVETTTPTTASAVAEVVPVTAEEPSPVVAEKPVRAAKKAAAKAPKKTEEV